MIITIKCPITWHERCKWIEAHCPGCKDLTYWQAWSIGHDFIYYSVSDQDALMYYLVWG